MRKFSNIKIMALLGGFPYMTPALADTMPDLLLTAPTAIHSDVPRDMPGNATSGDYKSITFNTKLFNLPPSSSVLLTTPEGQYHEIVFDKTVDHKNGDRSWVGYLRAGGKGFPTVITVGAKTLFGEVVTPEGTYSIVTDTHGQWLVNAKVYGESSGCGFSQNPGDDPVAAAKQNASPAASSGNPVTVDVAVLYDAGLKATHGQAGIETIINNYVAYGNLAFSNSDIHVTLNQIGAREVVYHPASGTDQTACETALSDFVAGRYGFAAAAGHGDALGADMLVYLAEKPETSSCCGAALADGQNPRRDKMRSVVYWDEACGYAPFIHQLGHNLGSDHDASGAGENAYGGPGQVAYAYSHEKKGDTFATLMARSDEGSAGVAYFSNPELVCDAETGERCGDADKADNARSINQVAPWVARLDSGPALAPAKVTGVSATDGFYRTKVVVTWSASSGTVSYNLYRGTSSSSGSATLLVSTSKTGYNDYTATPGTTYYYWVSACDSSGCASYSSSDTGYMDISVPSSVSASDGATLQVSVTWSAVTGATSYKLYRGTSSSSDAASLLTTTSASSYSDTTATVGVTYYYWVAACSSSECTEYSSSDSGYATLLPPSSVSAADGASTSQVSVSWSAVTGASSYQLYRGTSSSSASASLITTTTATSYSDTSASVGTAYHYWVVACNSAACSSYSSSDTGYAALSPPSSVSASDGASTSTITVTWLPVSGTSSYQIYRGTSNSSASASLLTTTTSTTYSDTSISAGSTYYYWIVACNGSICSSYSSSDSGYASVTTPTSVSASDGLSTSNVSVTWSSVSGASSYKLYRGTSSSSTSGSLLTTTTSTNYNDTSATSGTIYYYWVAACTGTTCSSYSNSDTGYALLPTPTLISVSDGTYGDRIAISWSSVSGATSYNLYGSTTSNSATARLLATASKTFHNDTTVSKGKTYYYWVAACNSTVCSSLSDYNSGYTAGMTAPTTVTASDGTYTSKVSVSWSSVSGASSYKLYRGTSSSSASASLMTTTTSTTYSDTTAGAGATYYYWVAACRGTVCSSYSTSNTGYALLSTPSSLKASDGTYSTMVSVTWGSVSGATSYKLYRGTSSSSSSASLITTTTSTTYSDTTATPGTTYYYWVAACSSAACSGYSSSNTGYTNNVTNYSGTWGVYVDGSSSKLLSFTISSNGTVSTSNWTNSVSYSGTVSGQNCSISGKYNMKPSEVTFNANGSSATYTEDGTFTVSSISATCNGTSYSITNFKGDYSYEADGTADSSTSPKNITGTYTIYYENVSFQYNSKTYSVDDSEASGTFTAKK